MSTKTLIISLILSAILLFTAAGVCFAGTSELLLQAETYREQGQYEQAEAIYQQIVTGYPGSDDALEAQKKLTLIYIATDREQQAEAAFGQLVAGFSEHTGISHAVWQVAKGYEQQKRYGKALELHQYNVQQFPPDRHAMWSQTEIIYLNINRGENAAADAAFERLVTVFSSQPTLPKEIHQIAMRYNSLERYDKALELYQYNAEHSPKDNIYTMWSQVEIVKSNIHNDNDAAVDAACDTLLNAFSEQPTLSKEVYQIADLYNKAGKSTKASRLYQHVVDNWPKSDQAELSQMNLAMYYVDQGDDLNAQAATDKLIANYSQNLQITKAIHDVAQHYRLSGKHEKANELYQYNVDNFSGDMYTMWSQVEIVKSYIRDANDPAADEAFDTLLSASFEQPTLSKEVYLIADLYSKAGKDDKALDLHEYNVEQLSKDDMYTMWSLVEIIKSHMSNSEYADANEACDILLAEFSQQPAFSIEVYQIAMKYNISERPEKAFQIHQYNIEHSSKDDMYTMWSKVEIIKSYIRDANDAAADEAFDKLLTEFSDQPTLPKEICMVGDVYAKAGRYEKAGQLFQHVLQNWPQSEHGMWAKSGIIKLDIYFGNDANVQPDLDQLIADFNDHPDLPEAVLQIGHGYYTKARLRLKDGLEGQAKEYYRKSITVWERITHQLPPSTTTPEAYYVSAVVYSQELGDYQKGIDYYQQVVVNWPDYEFAWHAQFFVGMYYEKLRNSGGIADSEAIPKIEQAYQAVIEKYPDSKSAPSAALKLASMNFESGQKVEAAMYYDLFLAIADPDDTRIKNVKARLEELKGEDQ